jgi:hypothetical protein
MAAERATLPATLLEFHGPKINDQKLPTLVAAAVMAAPIAW